MAKDFTEYAMQKADEIRETCSEAPFREEYREEAGSNGKRGEILVQIPLGDEVYLHVHEKVVKKLGGFHREVYCYALIVEGAHSDSWERDPTHPDEPIHGHEGDGRTRKVCEVVSFKEALEKAWEIVTARELAPWAP